MHGEEEELEEPHRAAAGEIVRTIRYFEEWTGLELRIEQDVWPKCPRPHWFASCFRKASARMIPKC